MKTQTFLSIFAAISCFGFSGASAADGAVSASRAEAEALLNQPAPHFEIETGVTATTRYESYEYLQATAAVLGTSLNEFGFRARVNLGYGRYNYPAFGKDTELPCLPNDANCQNITPVWIPEVGKFTGHEDQVNFLGGYEYVTERWQLLGLVGVMMNHQAVHPRDPDNMEIGTRWGVKFGAELWATPTNETMLWASGFYSAAFEAAEFDVRPGYLIINRPSTSFLGLSPGRIYVGPEVAYDSDLHDRDWRLGGHVTFSEFGPFHATVGLGYAHDRWNGPGFYGMVETSVRF
jgi:Cellulose biosynthesis protein BcsS